ncbi:MAG: NAD-dependent epimerase/dehydratase family protein [Candidatus Eisenbacteria bacterium]|nr:NAD-dependent epimerase/dehydratase family protein [Candidatus Eisenbacteria bacterium]
MSEERRDAVRTLVVGAGAAGAMVAEEMGQRPDHGYVIVGFLDDDPAKLGSTIAGAPVLAPISDLVSVAREHDVGQIVIAIPSASGHTIREVVRLCEEAGRSFKIVPGVWEIILGDVEINQIRPVELEDLLGRETVTLDAEEMRGYLSDRRVLVTGAGGSIGSELVRQVASFGPSEIVLMGRGENSIHAIDRELAQNHPEVDKTPFIGSVSNEKSVERVFRTHRPEIVYHAAAHKHVHLMEYYPEEAVRNNVTGTRLLVDASMRYGAERFVLLSTDKAVSPRGVMGASKRLAELLLGHMSRRSDTGTKLVAVRFGNVLGSRGSVVPMFKQQIRLGGPVTVTHPDVTRYFMTIREAAMLVIQAGFLGRGGEVFVLDMGDPIRIAELADHLIRLSGFEPGRDIPIEFTGLRPGEKLHEELWCSTEKLRRTDRRKILVVEQDPATDLEAPLEDIEELERLAHAGDREGVVRAFSTIFEGIEHKGAS